MPPSHVSRLLRVNPNHPTKHGGHEFHAIPIQICFINYTTEAPVKQFTLISHLLPCLQLDPTKHAGLMRPLLFRLGVAVALSLAGYLRFRPRPPRPKDELRIPTSVSPSSDLGLNRMEGLSSIFNSSSSAATTAASPSSKSSAEDTVFLLPEFSQLILDEFEESKRDQERMSAMEQEIDYLRNLVDSLRERERTLEIELLGEREGAVRELENRLTVSETEARVLSLKVETLQGENDRLREQASGAVAEMESVRANIHALQRKLRSDGEKAEGKIADVERRLAVLQEKARGDEENLTRLKELENEAMELRIVKSKMMQENSELKLKLRSVQMPTDGNGREDELLKETNKMRDENEKLKKDMEQLYNDRCMDVEELVYLRWINACLRYELRNYQPLPGKMVARDLSKSLSPESERKAKQLIVEYADFGIDERNVGFLLDFESDHGSSQASNEEPSDGSFDAVSSTKTSSSTKLKFISKFKKLVLGKDHHNQKASSVNRAPEHHPNSERRESISPCSLDETIGRRSNDSFSSCFSTELGSAGQSIGFESHVNKGRQNKGYRPPRSLDINRLRRSNLEEAKVVEGERCMSDMGMSYGYERLSGDDSFSDLSPDSSLDLFDIDDPETLELRKLAEALRISRGSPRLKKRAASFSFS